MMVLMVSLETEAFEAFCATFKVDSMKNEISSLLISHSDVRILYSRLVPSQVRYCSRTELYMRMEVIDCCIIEGFKIIDARAH